MFVVGDKVIHCTRGAGIITAKKEMQLTEAPQRYLVIQLLGSTSTLMVPTDQAEERLRPACKKTKLRRLLASELAGEPEELPGDYKKRQKYLEGKLKSGETTEWIEVVRDLTSRDEQKQLSTGDRQLLDRAMDLLAGELALARGIPLAEAMPRLKAVVQHRHELADRQGEGSNWWQTLGERVMEPFARSSAGTD